MRLGAPIESGEGDEAAIRYAGEEAERFELPGLWLSSEELAALLALNELLGRSDPGVLAGALAPFRARIERLLSDHASGRALPIERIRVISSGARKLDQAAFRAVASSLLNRQRLKFRYRARSTDALTERTVSPQRLAHYRDNWYLDAWDHARDALRSFALDRIRDPVLLDESALDREVAELDAHLASSYGIFSGQPKAWATIRFSSHAARWVADEHWHSQQQGTWLPDGRYELKRAVFELARAADGCAEVRAGRRDRRAGAAARGDEDHAAARARRVSGAAMSDAATPLTVSLVLGSGGARGYAHIGVIEELEARGFAIRSIAGSSMGALIGGIYAAGKLGVYTEWVRSLQRLDVLRLLDWTISGGGFIKGDRIIGVLKELHRRDQHRGSADSVHGGRGRSRRAARGLVLAWTAVRRDPRIDRDSDDLPPVSLPGTIARRRRSAQSAAGVADVARSDRLHDRGRHQRAGRAARRRGRDGRNAIAERRDRPRRRCCRTAPNRRRSTCSARPIASASPSSSKA